MGSLATKLGNGATFFSKTSQRGQNMRPEGHVFPTKCFHAASKLISRSESNGCDVPTMLWRHQRCCDVVHTALTALPMSKFQRTKSKASDALDTTDVDTDKLRAPQAQSFFYKYTRNNSISVLLKIPPREPVISRFLRHLATPQLICTFISSLSSCITLQAVELESYSCPQKMRRIF